MCWSGQVTWNGQLSASSLSSKSPFCQCQQGRVPKFGTGQRFTFVPEGYRHLASCFWEPRARIYLQNLSKKLRKPKNYLSCSKSSLCQYVGSQLMVHVFLHQQFRSVPSDLTTTVCIKTHSLRFNKGSHDSTLSCVGPISYLPPASTPKQIEKAASPSVKITPSYWMNEYR